MSNSLMKPAIDALRTANLGGDSDKYIRVNRSGGFDFAGKHTSTFSAQISSLNLYLAKWENSKMISIPWANEHPEGYKPRADLALDLGDGKEAILPIPSSSVRNLQAFEQSVSSRGYELGQVLTRFSTKEIKGKLGVFQVILMEPAGLAPAAEKPVQVVPAPAPVASANPWA